MNLHVSLCVEYDSSGKRDRINLRVDSSMSATGIRGEAIFEKMPSFKT